MNSKQDYTSIETPHDIQTERLHKIYQIIQSYPKILKKCFSNDLFRHSFFTFIYGFFIKICGLSTKNHYDYIPKIVELLRKKTTPGFIKEKYIHPENYNIIENIDDESTRYYKGRHAILLANQILITNTIVIKDGKRKIGDALPHKYMLQLAIPYCLKTQTCKLNNLLMLQSMIPCCEIPQLHENFIIDKITKNETDYDLGVGKYNGKQVNFMEFKTDNSIEKSKSENLFDILIGPKILTEYSKGILMLKTFKKKILHFMNVDGKGKRTGKQLIEIFMKIRKFIKIIFMTKANTIHVISNHENINNAIISIEVKPGFPFLQPDVYLNGTKIKYYDWRPMNSLLHIIEIIQNGNFIFPKI